MTTLEALQGMVGALERLEEQSCGCCVATVGAALATWRSRTPLVGDEEAMEAMLRALELTRNEARWAYRALRAIDALLAKGP